MSRFLVRLEKLARALIAPRRRPMAVKRILVAHALLLGDTVLLAPLLKKLALQYPDAERVLLCRSAYLPLFSGRPYGFTALGFDRRDAASQRRVMRSGPYDLAIVPDDNRYAWLARAAGARWICGFAGDSPGWKNFMLDDARPMSATPMAWADMAATLADGAAPAAFVAGDWPAPIAADFAMPAAPYAVLHVGASTPLKFWPAERWRQIAERCRAAGWTVVWSGGQGERDILEQIRPEGDDVDLIGKLDLAQVWTLLAGAVRLVCPDTGIGHLSRVVGVRSVALFGPGSALIHGNGEFWKSAAFTAVTIADFPCRDQTRLFRRELAWVRRCGRGFGSGPAQCPEPACMLAIDADRVAGAMALVAGVTAGPGPGEAPT